VTWSRSPWPDEIGALRGGRCGSCDCSDALSDFRLPYNSWFPFMHTCAFTWKKMQFTEAQTSLTENQRKT